MTESSKQPCANLLRFRAAARLDLRPRELRVLLALIAHADSATGECYPSTAAIAEEVGIARNNVSTEVASLAARGVIIDTGRRAGRTKGVKVWLIAIVPEGVSAPRHVLAPKHVLESSEGVSAPRQKVSRRRETEPTREPTKEQNTKQTSSTSRTSELEALIAEIWEWWAKLWKRNHKGQVRAIGASRTKAARSKLRPIVKDQGLEGAREIVQDALRWWDHDDHARQYGWETLLRHLEAWADRWSTRKSKSQKTAARGATERTAEAAQKFLERTRRAQ